jgi:hypothetical protein
VGVGLHGLAPTPGIPVGCVAVGLCSPVVAVVMLIPVRASGDPCLLLLFVISMRQVLCAPVLAIIVVVVSGKGIPGNPW